MKLYDLSKELFGASVFPGDPESRQEPVLSMENGAPCNLTRIAMGSHNGTHMDAPRHFCADGKPIDQVELEKCAGPCKLAELHGPVGGEQIAALLADGTKKLLLRGELELSLEAAQKMTECGLELLGVEGMTVGPVGNPGPVHRELLSHEVVILESAVMQGIPEGTYFLVSAPLKYGGLDGAQCRPILIDFHA